MSQYSSASTTPAEQQTAIDVFADGTASDVVDWCRNRVTSPEACHDFLIDFSIVSAEFLRYATDVNVPADAELIWGFDTTATSTDGPSAVVTVLQMLTAALNGDLSDLDAHAHAAMSRAASSPAWVGQLVGNVAVQVGRHARQARAKATGARR